MYLLHHNITNAHQNVDNITDNMANLGTVEAAYWNHSPIRLKMASPDLHIY